MSKYKRISGDYYVHEDIPCICFHKKPPDWIAGYLVEIYDSGYNRGVQKEFNIVKEFLSRYTNE